MGKTVFNPITTKWRGAIGGFRYSVVRGKQVIAERASAVKNPRTPGQMNTRTKFKLASQFSSLWKDLLDLNLVKIESDRVLTRSRATKVAFGAAVNTGDNADVVLGNFANDFNALNNQPVQANVALVFSSQTQTLTAPEGATVIYKVVAFDQDGTPIGSNVQTYLSDGTAKNIDLPAIFGNAGRYDIMAFTAEELEGAEEYTGKISQMSGKSLTAGMLTETYELFAKTVATSSMKVNGLVSGSTLVA